MSIRELAATERAERRKGDRLVAELDALGVTFLWGAHTAERRRPLAPAQLLAALASSQDARLRLALIPLFLHRPDYAEHARQALHRTSESARLTLTCYYAAARLLQCKHRDRLDDLGEPREPLPDLFSAALGLPECTDPDTGLRILAQRHTYLSGQTINWLGTYKHAAVQWLRILERVWAT